jgi:hypothetical protein
MMLGAIHSNGQRYGVGPRQRIVRLAAARVRGDQSLDSAAFSHLCRSLSSTFVPQERTTVRPLMLSSVGVPACCMIAASSRV